MFSFAIVVNGFFWLFFLNFVCYLQCTGDKSFAVDIYPGFGWDALRFLDLSPIYDVSNFNKSDVYQSCIELIPVHENKISLGSSVIDMFNSQTNDYASNTQITGSAGFWKIKAKGSYSNEYQRTKKTQGDLKSITLRNQIDYVMFDVILKPSCALNPDVKKDIIEISNYIISAQEDMATYAAQLFVSRYGTHFTSRLYLGGSIIEEDFIEKSTYEKVDSEKKKYQAAAEASFLTTFSVSSKFSSSTNNTDVETFKKQINQKFISSRGGKILLSNLSMESWQSSVEAFPVIVRRAVENITAVIQSDHIPELSEIDLAEVRSRVGEAIDTYVEMNVIRGCMNRTSPSFNWLATIDDGSCQPAEESVKFGGFIRTCKEDRGMIQ